ncbi:MAG TPA: META domain-containing protein [Muribaculaceae bacterium]|jgi:heat shock protein HslJ|nr:META domain-containing protein [Muribaculaceae bacterium]
MKINFHYAASAMITLFAAAVISSCGTTGKTATSGNIGSTTTHNSATTGHNQTGKPVQNKPAKGTASPSTDATLEKISGEWQIVKVGKKDIPVIDEMPYVNFEISSGRFYGSNGCNILNGSFNVDNTTISFNGVISTLKMCQDVEYQYDINAVIGDGKSYQVEATVEGGVNYIYLNDARGHHAITLRRSDMSFLNGQWKITRLGDKDIDNEEMNIFIDMPEHKVHGNTGCNYFNGDLYTSPNEAFSLSFGQMGVTRMACPDNNMETAMLLALEQTTNARPGRNGSAVLYDRNGNTLIVLERM